MTDPRNNNPFKTDASNESRSEADANRYLSVDVANEAKAAAELSQYFFKTWKDAERGSDAEKQARDDWFYWVGYTAGLARSKGFAQASLKHLENSK